MDISYAFLKQTLSSWPIIILIIFWVFTMRLQWSMAIRWGIKHLLVHRLPQVIQIELSKKDIMIGDLEKENKRLHDAVDRLWIDNKIIDKSREGK